MSKQPEWKPVPGDSRHEEKFIKKSDGSITRLTRRAGQERDYPHWTEMYKSGGKDTHYSERSGKHKPAHRTGSSIMDDLDNASSRSGCYIYDLLIYAVFLLGLAYGSAIYLLCGKS